MMISDRELEDYRGRSPWTDSDKLTNKQYRNRLECIRKAMPGDVIEFCVKSNGLNWRASSAKTNHTRFGTIISKGSKLLNSGIYELCFACEIGSDVVLFKQPAFAHYPEAGTIKLQERLLSRLDITSSYYWGCGTQNSAYITRLIKRKE